MPIRSRNQFPAYNSLESLPDELVHLVFEYLLRSDLRNVALVSQWAYSHAVAFLWKDISLVDKASCHPRAEGHQIWTDRGCGDADEHDDTPMLQRLLILAENPFLASKVQTLTHRCHLPTPAIFSELPLLYYHGPNLSQDPRTRKLLQLAIRNMVNVQTLRIIFGHHNIVKTLLEGFLDPKRPRRLPLRKLWLESCSLLDTHIDFGRWDLKGLESVRFRRLRAESTLDDCTSRMMVQEFPHPPEFRLCRAGFQRRMHNGAGGWYSTTIQYGEAHGPTRLPPFDEQKAKADAQGWDERIYDAIPAVKDFVDNAPFEEVSTPGHAPTIPMIHLLRCSVKSLTKLNLDWILWRKDERVARHSDDGAVEIMQQLAQLRFPHLRAFQVRNAVVEPTSLPTDLYLLEPGRSAPAVFLEFLEAHPKLTCLAWPMDRFYSHERPSVETIRRSRDVVSHLGRTLIDLRLDSYYDSQGEPFTDNSFSRLESEARMRRRRFVSEFAPQMTKLQQVKMEGGIPRDEKREVIRALYQCPLKKVVLIGVSCPLGNTWGPDAEDLRRLDEGLHQYPGHLEEEDKEAIMSMATLDPCVPEDFAFEPVYGWPPSPPLVHTIAALHASTITELKFCGYNGSPILSQSTPITKYLLHPIRHFHNLRQLVISMWLLTWFEDEDRDNEIIQSWIDSRSPSSTALVVRTPTPNPSPPLLVEVEPTIAYHNDLAPPPAPEFNRWAVLLKTKYSPSVLAYRVATDIGPYLSEQAKERKGGVRVRASFCLGTDTGDIFDLDLKVGKGDQMLEFTGPREEGEPGRWWDKLEARRWF